MRKPTPRELADLIDEDQWGQPNLMPVPVSPAISPDHHGSSGFQTEPNTIDAEHDIEYGTEMRQCAAGSCAHNESGRCCLRLITVNEHGGCADYEAMADDANDARYEEEDSDISGGITNHTPYMSPATNPDGY
jgi:hypothetical protein